MVTSLDIFEVLSRGLVIVHGSHEDGFVITWNGSLTLSAWIVGSDGMLSEVDVRTLSEVPPSLADAVKRCKEWLTSMNPVHNGRFWA